MARSISRFWRKRERSEKEPDEKEIEEEVEVIEEMGKRPSRLSKKICLIGDPAVGKTSLVRRFVIDQFDDKYITTIGSKVTKKVVGLESEPGETTTMTLLIWDVMGQKDYVHVQNTAYGGAAGALIVCDITRFETYENMSLWIDNLTRGAGRKLPAVLIANKSDLVEQYAFHEAEMRLLSERFGAPTIITSAKTGEHVEDAFKTLAAMIMRYDDEKAGRFGLGDSDRKSRAGRDAV